jgi:hypothetical protein
MGVGSSTRRGNGRRVAAWSALLLAASPAAGLQEVPLQVLASRIAARDPVQSTPAGIAISVQGERVFVVPLQGVVLAEVEYRASGDLLLTWTTTTAGEVPRPLESPWHHERLERGPGRLSLDFRTTPGWRPNRVPYFLLQGTGEMVITRFRVRTLTSDAAAERESLDDAIRWSPIRLEHTTINYLPPTVWWASRGTLLHEILGAAFLAAAILGTVAWRVIRKRWEPGPAIAVSAVAAALAGDVVFAIRARQSVTLEPHVEAAGRLSGNFPLAPELGKLAALARANVRPGDRIGVQAREVDWFAWETLCFHVAPHPCVQVIPGRAAWSGLSGVDRLTPDEVDVVVYLHAGTPLLPGFSPVAALGPEALVARRR